MKAVMAGVLAVMWCSGVAHAQTLTPESRGYVEAIAQSAFGNVTSQSYGGEIGVTLVPQWQLFFDAGQIRDASSSDLGASARLIAGYLSQTQSNVAFQAKQPVTFGVVGVRYAMSVPGARIEPYLSGGLGLARMKREVSFSVAGNDVTGSVSQFGVALGTDLTGSETKPMYTLGGGLAWPVWQHLVVDFQYRYGRVQASEKGLNVSRAGVGLGLRF